LPSAPPCLRSGCRISGLEALAHCTPACEMRASGGLERMHASRDRDAGSCLGPRWVPATSNIGSPPDARAAGRPYVGRMSGGLRTRRTDMPRNVVQRTFPEGLHIPIENGGAELCGGVVERNAEEGVTWLS